MVTTERLAEELHKFYRAAFKALAKNNIVTAPGAISHLGIGHDHGWSRCNKKKYFIRRAMGMQLSLGIGIIEEKE